MPTNEDRIDALEVDSAAAVDVAAIAAETARVTAKQENRRQRRNWLTGYIILLVAVAGAYYTSTKDGTESRNAIVTSSKVVSVEGCNRDFDTYSKLRAVFKRGLVGLKNQHQSGAITDKQYEAGKAFYAQQLVEFTLPDCRKVENIITSDPRKTKYPPPYPRYEGGGRSSSKTS